MFDIPLSTSQYRSQSNSDSGSDIVPAFSCASAYLPSPESSTHGGASGSSHFASTGPTTGLISNNHELPTSFPNVNRLPRTSGQVSNPRIQRAGAAITLFDAPDPLRYAGGFLATPNTGSPPVPRLRPASWGSPSQTDGAPDSHRLTRSRSSADFREDSSDEEDLPFGRRTLPPLPIPYDPRRSGFRTAPSTNPTPSRDISPDSEDLSATNSVFSTSFPSNHSEGGYR